MPRAVSAKHTNLHRWTVTPRGGPIGPAEQPDLIVEPHGWRREVWRHDRGRGFTPVRIAPGDLIEFGADHPVGHGRKHLEPHRWYGFIAAAHDAGVVAIGPYPGPLT